MTTSTRHLICVLVTLICAPHNLSCTASINGAATVGAEAAVSLAFKIVFEGPTRFRIADLAGTASELRFAENDCARGTWTAFRPDAAYDVAFSAGAGKKTLCAQLRATDGTEGPAVTAEIDVATAPAGGATAGTPTLAQADGGKTELSPADAKDGQISFEGTLTAQGEGPHVLQARLARTGDGQCYRRASKTFGGCDDAWIPFDLPPEGLTPAQTVEWIFQFAASALTDGAYSLVVQATNPFGTVTESQQTFTWKTSPAPGPGGPKDMGVPPAAPVVSSGLASTATSLSLSWAAAPNAASYRVAVVAGPTAPVACAGEAGDVGNVTTTNLGSLSPNTQYSARVCAVGANGAVGTGESSTVTAFTLAATPSIASVAPGGAASLSVVVDRHANPSATEVAVRVVFGATTKWVASGGGLHDTVQWVPASAFAGSGVTVGGLAVGTLHTLAVKARNANGVETSLSMDATAHTAAAVPGAPAVATAASGQLRVTIQQNGNPSTAEYAVRVSDGTTTSWVRPSDGALQATAQWGTYAEFGGGAGKLVGSLVNGTSYSFAVKARNGANVETALSGATAGTPVGASFTITSPANGATINSNVVPVSWSGLPANTTEVWLYASDNPLDCTGGGSYNAQVQMLGAPTSGHIDMPWAASVTGAICVEAYDGSTYTRASNAVTVTTTRPAGIFDFFIKNAAPSVNANLFTGGFDVYWTVYTDAPPNSTEIDTYEITVVDGPYCATAGVVEATISFAEDFNGQKGVTVNVGASNVLPLHAYICLTAKKDATSVAAVNTGYKVQLLATGEWNANVRPNEDDPMNPYYPEARADHVQTTLNDGTNFRTIIWGGRDGSGAMKKGYLYDGNWRPFLDPAEAPAARSGAVFQRIHDAELFVWGGRDGTSLLSDGARLALDYSGGVHVGETWTSVATGSAPSARADASISRMHDIDLDIATATPTLQEDLSVFMVWGGLGPGGALNSGAMYVFSDGVADTDMTNTWQPMTSVGAPTPRSGHVAGTVGNWDFFASHQETEYRFVVWGGVDGTTYRGDGASYAPGPLNVDSGYGSWLPLPATGAPSARAYHAGGVVEFPNGGTDYYLVVWGGYDGTNYLGDGKRMQLDVANNAALAWVPMATLNAPSPRAHANAIIVGGDTLVVWGGRNASGWLNDGAIYTGRRDAWIPMADPGTAWVAQHGSGTFLGRQGHRLSFNGENGNDLMIFGGFRDAMPSYHANTQSGAIFIAPVALPWPSGG